MSIADYEKRIRRLQEHLSPQLPDFAVIYRNLCEIETKMGLTEEEIEEVIARDYGTEEEFIEKQIQIWKNKQPFQPSK